MGTTLEKGLGYLESHQQTDGSFLSFSSANQNDFTGARHYHSPFASALILDCLTSIQQESSKHIRQHIADFLLNQRSEHWSFNYWQRQSRESKAKPYPDDLDDTFCALAALTRHDPALIDGEAMARIITLLTAVEEAEGGPYRTWLVPDGADKAWQDVDLAVNSNVAYFLSLHDIELPNLTQLIETAIAQSDYSSPYYPSLYPVIYFISRSYNGGKSSDIRSFLLAQRNEKIGWGNALHTALAITALLNLGEDPRILRSDIQSLRLQQRNDSSWPPHAFCLDPAIKQQPYYAGSSVLATAFCLEAISKYQLKNRRSQPKTKQDSKKDPERLIVQEIKSRAYSRISSLDDALKNVAAGILDKTLASDSSQQITLLTYSMRQALGKGGENIPDELVITLGLANLYGWIAYTIYDDFLDQEGTPPLLPVANVFLREAVQLFKHALSPDTQFNQLASEIIDTIENANAWEATYCHFTHSQLQGFSSHLLPDYGDQAQLANKSLGHVLGPAGLLVAIGHAPSSQLVQALTESFRYFIIARQLNDDAHDWQDDLRRGHINAVSALLLKQFIRQHPTAGLNLTSEKMILRLQEFFWQITINDVCSTILQHVEKAQDIISHHPAIAYPHHLTKFFDPVKSIAEQTISEQKKTNQFIRAYSRVASE